MIPSAVYRFFGMVQISSGGCLPLSIWTSYLGLGQDPPQTQEIWERSQSEPISLYAYKLARKDSYSGKTEKYWELGRNSSPRSALGQVKHVWLFRGHLYGLREGVDSSDEAGVLIKHWLYKQGEKFKRMKSEVAAYEKFEQLEDKLVKSNKREPLSQEVKMLVWKRDEGKCVECGSKRKLEFDHIIPFSKGGSNTARNIQILCEKCNRSKSDNL